MSKEKAILDFETEIDEKRMKYVKHIFAYGFVNKEVKVPMYENEGPEHFIRTVREFNDMIFRYAMLPQNPINVYEFFYDTLKGSARDSWTNALAVTPGQSALTWPIHLRDVTRDVIGSEAYSNQREWLRSARKPRSLKAGKWVRRLKTINNYLTVMDPDRQPYTEQQLVEYCIAPNIPHEWALNFRLARGHLSQTTRDAVDIMEEIEMAEPKKKPERKEVKGKFEKRDFKYRRNDNRKIKGKFEKNKKFKNECKKHGHHEWEDCFDNPNGKKFKGDRKTFKGKFDRNKDRRHENRSTRRKKNSRRSRKERHDSDSNSSSSDSEESRKIDNTQ